jgi:hypothetical protein
LALSGYLFLTQRLNASGVRWAENCQRVVAGAQRYSVIKLNFNLEWKTRTLEVFIQAA